MAGATGGRPVHAVGRSRADRDRASGAAARRAAVHRHDVGDLPFRSGRWRHAHRRWHSQRPGGADAARPGRRHHQGDCGRGRRQRERVGCVVAGRLANPGARRGCPGRRRRHRRRARPLPAAAHAGGAVLGHDPGPRAGEQRAKARRRLAGLGRCAQHRPGQARAGAQRIRFRCRQGELDKRRVVGRRSQPLDSQGRRHARVDELSGTRVAGTLVETARRRRDAGGDAGAGLRRTQRAVPRAPADRAQGLLRHRGEAAAHRRAGARVHLHG